MCVWGELFCTRAFLALVSHGMKTGTTNSRASLLCMASRRTLPAMLQESRGKSRRRQCPCCHTGFPTSLSLHAHLPQLCSSSRLPSSPEKSIFPSFSLGWATATAFHITARLANFPILFFLPRVSIQRVVHPDVLPWLALCPDSPEVRAERSK